MFNERRIRKIAYDKVVYDKNTFYPSHYIPIWRSFKREGT